MKRYIVCQSEKLNKVRNRLDNNAPTCITHLAKLWLFPNSSNINHWRHEVWNCYKDVPKLKRDNKPPKAQEIYKWIWLDNKDYFDSYMGLAEDEEYKLIPNSNRLEDVKRLYENMENYFVWLSEILSYNRVVRSNTVYNKLKELGF